MKKIKGKYVSNWCKKMAKKMSYFCFSCRRKVPFIDYLKRVRKKDKL